MIFYYSPRLDDWQCYGNGSTHNEPVVPGYWLQLMIVFCKFPERNPGLEFLISYFVVDNMDNMDNINSDICGMYILSQIGVFNAFLA